MDALLVAGAETMIGANFAAQLAEQFEVTACFFDAPHAIAGCEIVHCAPDDRQAIEALFQEIRPQRMVYCGVGTSSAWTDSAPPTDSDVQRAELWLNAARAVDCHVTMVSSDAVLTGPWMFHPENGHSLCPSAEAKRLLAIEQRTYEICPESLLIRTHAFGWSCSWLETLLKSLESGQSGRFDCVRHASPILVNDLIDIVTNGWNAGLSGVYHVCGAERINPAAFAQRLAAEFGLRIPKPAATESLSDRSTGFGRSETSLQTRKIRRALGLPVPLLGDGFRRLRQLSLNGFRSRLFPSERPTPTAKVA
jgi:dTDP-4-dehydrorhamnose reductase